MEVTIFKYLDSILHNKQYVEEIKSDESQYNSFMCNRWISMYSNTAAEIINESSNKYWPQLMSQQDHYEFLLNLMPRYSRKRINYIKKVKEEKTTTPKDNTDAMIAKRLEISKREVALYQSLAN